MRRAGEPADDDRGARDADDRGACSGPWRLARHPHHADPEHDPAVAALLAGFWVVAAVSNPSRFRTRHALYRKFRHHVLRELRANLLTVECAFGERAHQVLEPSDVVVRCDDTCPDSDDRRPRAIDVRVRNSSWVWLKENLWNVGAAHLPADARYVLFADADVQFLNRNVVTETIHALQTHPVVQPWETCADLGPDGQIMAVHRSFGWCAARGWEWKPVRVPTDGRRRRKHDGAYEYVCRPDDDGPAGFGNPWHPGFALAFRREVLDRLPLLDVGALGAGDHHMCTAMIGKADLSLPGGIGDGYRRRVLAWQAAAARWIRGDLGFVPGSIVHYFHGPKRARRYLGRWKVLVDNAFDPDVHLLRNAFGVLELDPDAPTGLRDGMREYFTARNEDSVEAD